MSRGSGNGVRRRDVDHFTSRPVAWLLRIMSIRLVDDVEQAGDVLGVFGDGMNLNSSASFSERSRSRISPICIADFG